MQWFQRAERLLSLALDGVQLRQQITAHNIANVNTPGYKRASIPFEERLRAVMESRGSLPLRRTQPAHLPGRKEPSLDGIFAPQIDHSTRMRNDGNNVDIDAEMAMAARDSIAYQAMVQQISAGYRSLRTAISEGRR